MKRLLMMTVMMLCSVSAYAQAKIDLTLGQKAQVLAQMVKTGNTDYTKAKDTWEIDAIHKIWGYTIWSYGTDNDILIAYRYNEAHDPRTQPMTIDSKGFLHGKEGAYQLPNWSLVEFNIGRYAKNEIKEAIPDLGVKDQERAVQKLLYCYYGNVSPLALGSAAFLTKYYEDTDLPVDKDALRQTQYAVSMTLHPCLEKVAEPYFTKSAHTTTTQDNKGYQFSVGGAQ